MKNFLFKSGGVLGGFALALVLSISVSAQIKLRTAVNYDTDTKADFVTFRPSNNSWLILKSAGGTVNQQFGSNTDDIMTPGDYDGDGKGDIAVWRDAAAGNFFYLRSSDNAFVAAQFGISGDEPIARDYDGDGKTDIAVCRRTGGSLFWYSVNSSNQAFQANQFGTASDYTAPGDYDGDGKFDLAVQRPSPGNGQAFFFIRPSTAPTTLTSIAWGLSNDLFVPGDYDGDGKTDIAIVREGTTANSPLIWAYLRSSGGAPVIVGFGLTGADITVQNDYDGDGKCDIAVFRDPTANFYYLSSATGNLVGQAWGAAGDFPVAGYDTH